MEIAFCKLVNAKYYWNVKKQSMDLLMVNYVFW